MDHTRIIERDAHKRRHPRVGVLTGSLGSACECFQSKQLYDAFAFALGRFGSSFEKNRLMVVM